MIQHIPTNGLLNYLRYLIRIGELERVQGVCAAFENRLDRHSYVSAFEEIVAECALTDSGDDLGKRLARICRLAADADAKIAQFARLDQEPADAMLVTTSPLFVIRAGQIAALAVRHRIPAIYARREYVEAGGLMSYGFNVADLYR